MYVEYKCITIMPIDQPPLIPAPMELQTYSESACKRHLGDIVKIGCQPKLDGVNIRIVSKDNGQQLFVFTRGGHVKHNWFETRGIFAELHMPPNNLIVCELYHHGEMFSKINGFSQRKNDRNLLYEEFDELRFHVFDMVNLGRYEPYYKRYADLKALVEQGMINSSIVRRKIRLVPMKIIPNNKSLIDTYFATSIANGYEGIVIRNPLGMYEGKRSWNVLKYKKEEDGEWPIIGSSMSASNVVMLHFKSSSGSLFNVPWSGPDAKNRTSWNGFVATLIYTCLYESSCIPRDARVKSVDSM